MADKQFEIAGIQRLFPEVSPGVFVEGVGLAGVITGADIPNGMLFVRQKDGFSTGHVPAVNVRATITRAAGGIGIKHVCTGFTFVLAGGTTAPAAAVVTVAVIDGASGGGTFLFGPLTLGLEAVAGKTIYIARSALWLAGSFNTALTAEFNVAAGANSFESVTLEGISIQ